MIFCVTRSNSNRRSSAFIGGFKVLSVVDAEMALRAGAPDFRDIRAPRLRGQHMILPRDEGAHAVFEAVHSFLEQPGGDGDGAVTDFRPAGEEEALGLA